MPSLPKTIQYTPKGNVTEIVNELISEAEGKESLSLTYNPDKTVSNISGATTNIDFTYNLDKTVNTIDDGTQVTTFAYNPNKTVASTTVSPS